MKTIEERIEEKIIKLNNKIKTFEERKKELEERKKKVEVQIKEQDNNIAKVKKEIRELESEKETKALKDLLIIANNKNIDLDELKNALISGDLLELQEKMEQAETEKSY